MKGIKKIFSGKTITFGAIFIIAFAGSLYLFSAAGLAPKGVSRYLEAANPTENISGAFAGPLSSDEENGQNSSVSPEGEPRAPERIVIDKIGVDVSVLNPSVSNSEVLNEKLKEGVVRYPDSGLLGDDRNMLLMGHASTLPGIQNEMYEVFSKIRQLNIGDKFKLYSQDKVFFYKVVEMTLTDKNEAKIDFDSGKRQVTLSTCNTLGEKSERFVVRANFVESFPLD